MRPMLATAGESPTGGQWLYEVKWDGIRVLAEVVEGVVRLHTRSGRDITAGFPELAGLGDTATDLLLDGEIIALAGGLPSFAALSERIHITDRRRAGELAEVAGVSVMAFDLLRLHGVELLDRPLLDRRASLERLALPAAYRVSPAYDDGPALLAATREHGLEGVVAKRRGSRYQPGRRSPDWIKTPHLALQSCVVIGWRPETGTADRIGALLLAVPDDDGVLSFAGRVGSGLGAVQVRALRERFADSPELESCPLPVPPPPLDAHGARWVRPDVVVEVRHAGWTGGDRLRHPVFRGIRADLAASEVTREQ